MTQRLGNRGMTVALGKAEDELRSRGTISIGTRKTIKLGARTQTMKVGPADDMPAEHPVAGRDPTPDRRVIGGGAP